MTPVDQTISDSEIGDCVRAVIASIFDLDIRQVPHFMMFKGDSWHYVLTSFLWSIGWNFNGTGYFDKRKLLLEDSVNGYFDATVKSRNFEGKNHAVVININGVVVHDPSPTKRYQGENVFENGELLYWSMMSPRTDEAWLSWTKST